MSKELQFTDEEIEEMNDTTKFPCDNCMYNIKGECDYFGTPVDAATTYCAKFTPDNPKRYKRVIIKGDVVCEGILHLGELDGIVEIQGNLIIKGKSTTCDEGGSGGEKEATCPTRDEYLERKVTLSMHKPGDVFYSHSMSCDVEVQADGSLKEYVTYPTREE